VDLQRAAYFFDYETDAILPDSSYSALINAVSSWKEAWSDQTLPELVFRTSPGLVQVYDTRWPQQEGTYTYEGVLADLYVACTERPVTARKLCERLEGQLSEAAIEEVLADWQASGLVFRDGPTVLALALPAGPSR